MATSALLRPETQRPIPACMTRCQCADVSFEEVRRHVRGEGLSVPDACRRSGCGQLCTACLPDLEAYLSEGR